MPFAEERTIAKLEENVQKITSVTNLLEEGHTPDLIDHSFAGNFEAAYKEFKFDGGPEHE